MLLLQETKHKEYSERGCTTIFSQNYSMLRSLCPFAGVGACCVGWCVVAECARKIFCEAFQKKNSAETFRKE